MKKMEPSILIFLVIFVFSGYLGGSGQLAEDMDHSIKNIETFTRLYGYVRYFYPGDEAAQTDWEKFAVYGVKKVEKVRNRSELKQALQELFLPIAPALVIHDSNRKTRFSSTRITPPPAIKKKMNVVVWQHLGVGFGEARSIYRSIRLNRKDELTYKRNIGVMIQVLDAAPFQGKQVKLRAAVKVAEGAGHMWLRVDRMNKAMGFFDNMNDRPVKSNEWNYYEITGPVAEDAQRVVFGCFLQGSGQLWVDDYQFFVKEDKKWKSVTLKNPDFEEDKDGGPPQEWIALSEGYSYQVTADTAARGRKSTIIKSDPGSGLVFDRKPQFGEHISKELGSRLSCLMPIALYGTEDYTYPKASPAALNRLKAAIEEEVPKEEKLSGDVLYVRLGDIVMAWNIFQHFYPYFDVTKTDWNASLTEALASAYNDKNKQDFLKTLRKLVAHLKDGHGRVYLKGDTTAFHAPPIQWDWIEGKLVITGIFHKFLKGIHMGDVVVEIDGVKAKDAIKNEALYISAATEGWLHYRTLNELLAGPKDSQMTLKIERDGEFHEITLQRSEEYMKYYNKSKNNVYYKKIDEDIYYLNLNNIPVDDINQLMPELEKAKAIICDLRGYPNSNHQLISHLLKEKDEDLWMWVPQIIYPDYENVTYKGHGWHMKPLKPHLTAKIVFITNGRAISYAESFMGYIEHYKLATIVGQPTAGTNGNVNPFTLPGGYRVMWTGMRVLKHDGSQHHGVGIIPHVRVERTIKGVKEGRDEFLEKAIEIAKK
ncbi:MAG: peptidase S41 [Candidatus Aminicenantes bacterium]|nr:peptidase S41 [Candidatus Aminicenantes bacterium]NIM77794.1 peptidase S41 [Candidatus Aminicenantes bacterium]NIN17107.1 peptidase S41 [Candidatus Aminicenantes bacterium]NIN41000.1 peptidase S41 [Candidatus Aminicenantes bacterium]NIN83805.1 peptidase S41 [Candidatus Aminicenantes bacterium]